MHVLQMFIDSLLLTKIWGHFLVKNGSVVFCPCSIFWWKKMIRKKFKKWRCLFFAIFSKSKISNKFRPPISSMGTLFVLRSPKNRSFFAFGGAILSREVPQQHHLSEQYFGGHVALKQHLLFLLPKIVDFIRTRKKSAPQMKIGVWGGEKAETSTEISGRGPSTNMLPICNIT